MWSEAHSSRGAYERKDCRVLGTGHARKTQDQRLRVSSRRPITNEIGGLSACPFAYLRHSEDHCDQELGQHDAIEHQQRTPDQLPGVLCCYWAMREFIS